ncbi:MAG: 1-(5-phosphoribosyl)-5-((5-phosphoribosylamino)methylideneamino) imidazole-4-carboxamide isomerase [Methanosaeta sp. PtaB.Bin039]|nr:MAG: 1-(5-phosphoribosyl)-5-((5-phosphoribosylamino)methylideneamino) imidazole-4-carboxamide isomerase [Methanosaeta sp. PtaB.Bin039]OPY47702.1 MAG: 1-(5-phosphoribosyl)-5-((5-phosphoribosylamino)methylideneamino) imidazole-4-carboxamide isomerase [Methanosaeta sp. PtaU1.Bin028]HOT07858.1 HisA/HisF-related TIM barrel protein [Methanotrichaceae archaeon]HQF17565.1 HisA/HisF-related TIM barrel protein [Methanotrichaceae archaeon]HQI92141.1 HisA/HisF-related TIM barrel protein [Methanotrichace
MNAMRCVFVMDLFNGEVVHAVRGQRNRYRPVHEHSRIVTTSDPIDLLKEASPKEVYLADLNRLTGQGGNLQIVSEISLRVRTIADIGMTNRTDLDLLKPPAVPVLGTESATLSLMEEASSDRDVVVSLDLLDRQVLSRDQTIPKDPFEALRMLNRSAFREIIILELDRVGTCCGLDRDFLQSAANISRHELLLGGGVRSASDLSALEDMGFAGALVATAVHDRSIPLDRLRQ